MHIFYVIAVPIGNLKEITILAQEKLTEISIILCEDTRVTQKLLNLLKINNKKKLLCVNQFNESKKADEILNLLKNNDCALVSDAGYPVISDPGYFLIKKLREKGVTIQVINGPCAFIHALVTSGIDSRKIYWANFLSKRIIKRKSEILHLKEIIHKEATIIYYESPYFLIKGLQIIKDIFGDIEIGVAKELTKIYETFYFDNITNLIQNITVKGEFVIIIPRNKNIIDSLNLEEKLKKIHQLIHVEKVLIKEATKVYKDHQHNSSFLYSEYLKKFKT